MKYWASPNGAQDRQNGISIETSRHQTQMIMDALDRITVNPEVCKGMPTIRGLRIPVSVVLKMLASGHTTEDVLEAYPELEEQDLQQAMRYAAWTTSDKTRAV
jgi:uncharacterized protein (DUF433 family)